MWRAVTLLLLLVARVKQIPAFEDDDDEQESDRASRFKQSGGPGDEWNEIFAEEYREAMFGGGGDEQSKQYADVPFGGKLELVEDWPLNDLKLGQVGGLATDNNGYVHIFHRADRSWDYDTFDENNTFVHKVEGPIKQPTMYTVNASNGVILNKWAANFFYLPHGLTVDQHGNFWMTDVVMHQVFKFEAGKDKPLMTLGKLFEPAKSNDDTERFCKPTDVAVASNDDFFVSDGYCASRVLKFSKSGKLIGQFGIGDFEIPHSLALAEDLDLICVADRENLRILCYNAGLKDATKLGEPEREYNDESLGRIYAIAYSPVDGLLYGVTGPTGILIPQGFTIDLREDERYNVDLIATWSPDDKGFDEPHAVAVTPDGGAVFVGETKPNVVWKFVKEQQD